MYGQPIRGQYAEARAEVEAGRLPLARKVSELEQTLLNRRAELAKLQRFQENQLVELNALKTEAKRLSDEVKYTDSLVTEYGRAFRSRLNFVEEPRYAAMLDAVDKAGASADLSAADKLTQRVVLLTTATQVTHLLQIADQLGLADGVRAGLRRAMVASIGPTTSETLREHGVAIDMEPSHPKMGFLVREAAERASQVLAAKRLT